MQNLLIVIYAHHESYPPTLNAIFNLAPKFNNVYIVHKNHLVSSDILPRNCILICREKFTTVKESLKISKYQKISNFINFCLLIKKTIKNNNISHCISYDAIALFSLYITNSLKKSIHFWYHNHDITLKSACSKFSIGWFSAALEKKAMKKIDIFSLPAAERLKYFCIQPYTQYFFLPNYPSRHLYDKFLRFERKDNSIRLIYQGALGPNHGLEEIVSILNTKINDKNVELFLKGSIDDNFKEHLIGLSKKYNVFNNLHFNGYTSYDKVPELASNCDIGIAIHKGTDIMNLTLGTSSNKIYEYAALGLPVILYSNEHFKNHLQEYSWANFTNCSSESLIDIITIIDNNYQRQSEAALKDFNEKLNFEKAFLDVRNAFLK